MRSRGWRSGQPCRRGRGLRSSRQTSRGLRGDIEGERGAVALTGAVDDTDGHTARMDRFGGLQRADDKGDEVGRHHHRRGVLNAATAIVEGGLGDLARVGDGEMVGIDDQRCLEGRLVLGLVPTREATASVGRLELGGGDRVLGAVVGGVRRPIEAVKLIVEVPSNVTCTVAGPAATSPSRVSVSRSVSSSSVVAAVWAVPSITTDAEWIVSSMLLSTRRAVGSRISTSISTVPVNVWARGPVPARAGRRTGRRGGGGVDRSRSGG